MKKLFIFIFMLSIVGLFAAVNYNNAKQEGDPIKKQTTVKSEVKKPERVLNTCSDAVQARIAGCYGVDPTDVCCVSAMGLYTILSSMYQGQLTITSCGTNCTHFYLLVNGITPCEFELPYSWPC